MQETIFKLFSDGASFNNGFKNPNLPQFSSCGVIITLNEKVLYKGYKGFDNQNISYAELKGAIIVLDKFSDFIKKYENKIFKPYKIKLISDSQFVVKGKEEWLKNWLKGVKDWRNDPWYNSQGKIVGQIDLWRELKDKYLDNSDYNIEFLHIKGHSKKIITFEQKMNDECDRMASLKIEEMKKNKNI